jgi:hypothetical protein
MVDVAMTALTLGVMLVREDMCAQSRTKVIGHRISFAMLVAGRAMGRSTAICWWLVYSLRNTKGGFGGYEGQDWGSMGKTLEGQPGLPLKEALEGNAGISGPSQHINECTGWTNVLGVLARGVVGGQWGVCGWMTTIQFSSMCGGESYTLS